jgi:hypothetical protein
MKGHPMTNPLDALPEHAYDEARQKLSRLYAEYERCPASMEHDQSTGGLTGAVGYIARRSGVELLVQDRATVLAGERYAAYWESHRRGTHPRTWWPTDDPDLAAAAPPLPVRSRTPEIAATWQEIQAWLSRGRQASLFELAAAA